jgi:hypothetical protein
LFIKAEHLFKKSSSTGLSYLKFVHHDKVYPPNNDFVKNDIIIVCCQIVRGSHLLLHSNFNLKFWDSYAKGFTGECTLKVSGREFKVRISTA